MYSRPKTRTKRETYRAYNEQAVLSKSLGFTFDPTSVQNEIAACNTVLTQYAIGLNSGGLDPDKYVPELNKKLKAAGIDTIIAEKQRQVDAWAPAG
nr:DUF3502 domain-containing protein [Paenibacillus rhizovicinus]